ncbi:MAG: 5-(carboxyamino)imidazole ribonucleotide synthase [Pseudanabaenaceae cyanobacterium]
MNRIGVIGGGQLAQMLAIASKELDIELIVQADSITDIAVPYASSYLVGRDYTDLIQSCPVITFENEFVDPKELQSQGGKDDQFIPNLGIMQVLVDKYYQREHLRKYQLPMPEFLLVDPLQEITSYGDKLGYPCVLKARQHGYDGKGTWIANSPQDLGMAWAKIGRVPAILEAFVPYVKELAIMVGCDRQGQICLYPIVETVQTQQVCDLVLVPAEIPIPVAEKIREIAQVTVKSFQSAGIFGIELFLTGDQQILINEIAPRVHNSGHYTIEACDISQFTQLLRICVGLPAITPKLNFAYGVMVNLLGYADKIDDYLTVRDQIQALPNTYLHWYGKKHSRIGRKLGHVTILGSDPQTVKTIAESARTIWYSHVTTTKKTNP